MTICALVLGLALAPRSPDTTAEYTFKNIRAAYFAAARWDTLAELVPGIRRSPSGAAPVGAASWIWVDEKLNRFVIGSKDDSAPMIAQYLQEFDVAPKPVRLTVRLARTDWGVEARSTIDTVNNAETTFSSEQSDLGVVLRPRINNDGTVTLWLTTVQGGKNVATTVMRVRTGGRVCWREGKVFTLGAQEPFHVPDHALPTKPALPLMYEIDVKAEIG